MFIGGVRLGAEDRHPIVGGGQRGDIHPQRRIGECGALRWVGYGSGNEEVPMLRALVLAIGIPLGLLLLAVLALELWRVQLPPWLQRLAERPSWLWNIGIGLIIGLSLLQR